MMTTREDSQKPYSSPPAACLEWDWIGWDGTGFIIRYLDRADYWSFRVL
jgi:hypothetical protein